MDCKTTTTTKTTTIKKEMAATNDSMEVEYYNPNNTGSKDGSNDTSEWQPLTVSSSNRDNNYGSSNSSRNGEEKKGARPMIIATDLECRTQLRRWDNIGLPICYLTVGMCQGKQNKKYMIYVTRTTFRPSSSV
jgi:hypothetical protein